MPSSLRPSSVISVDLPMPGSPATSVRLPTMAPPPRTRSNSASPVGSRCRSATVTSLSRWGRAPDAYAPTMRGALPPAPPSPLAARPERMTGALTAVGTASSTSVFHALQPLHWPAHRGAEWPHSWHTNWVLDLAIALGAGPLAAGVGAPRSRRA